MTRILCTAPHCAGRNLHTENCDNGDCWGCHPRPAHDGANLCMVCTRRIAEDAVMLGQIHDDLVLTLRRAGGGERTSGTVDRSPAVDDAVVDARTRIRLVLRGLRNLIVVQRGVEGRIPDMVTCGQFLATHAEWLAAHPDAGQHAAKLRDLAADGHLRALAYPTSRRGAVFIGLCPAVVDDPEVEGGQRSCGWRVHREDGDPSITCGSCGLSAPVAQWERWMVDDLAPDAVVDAYAGAAALARMWMRPEVDPALLRQWVRRQKLAPRMVAKLEWGDGGLVPVTVEESRMVGGEWTTVRVPVTVPERGENNRMLFDMAALVAAATGLWGEPPQCQAPQAA